MKKIVILLLVFVFAASGCKDKKPAEYTMLGDYTPFAGMTSKINGKVEKVSIRLYWAIPVGETFKKGNRITDHERDSANWFYDCDIVFDNSGDLKTVSSVNETGKTVAKWEFLKENNVLALAKRTLVDTLSFTEKLKFNSDGDILEASRFRAGIDTLIYTYKFSYSGDIETRQTYNYSGNPTNKRVAVVDAHRQFLNVSYYNRDGVYTSGRDINYNEKGDLVGMINYDKDKKVTADWIFSDFRYDDHGNWIEIFEKEKVRLMNVYFERLLTYYE